MRFPLAHVDQLAEMRKRRAPFTDPRQGRLHKQISRAFQHYGVDVLPSTPGRMVLWPKVSPPARWISLLAREMVKRAALQMCVCLGRSPKGRGRPMLWKLDPEKAALRGLV
jgi:hypothetical protein